MRLALLRLRVRFLSEWVTAAVCVTQGIPFGDLHRYFDDGTPYGLVNMRTGACSFNPSNKTIITAGVCLQSLSEYALRSWHRHEQVMKCGTAGLSYSSGCLDGDGVAVDVQMT